MPGRGRRRRGRELALKVLFEIEGTQRDALEALDYHVADGAEPPDVAAFARSLVVGALQGIDTVDGAIARASTNWGLEELGKVERAVLRLGAYELAVTGDVPVGVAIDEAIELARAYAGEEAAAFVNGVLGRIAREAPPRSGRGRGDAA